MIITIIPPDEKHPHDRRYHNRHDDHENDDLKDDQKVFEFHVIIT